MSLRTMHFPARASGEHRTSTGRCNLAIFSSSHFGKRWTSFTNKFFNTASCASTWSVKEHKLDDFSVASPVLNTSSCASTCP